MQRQSPRFRFLGREYHSGIDMVGRAIAGRQLVPLVNGDSPKRRSHLDVDHLATGREEGSKVLHSDVRAKLGGQCQLRSSL